MKTLLSVLSFLIVCFTSAFAGSVATPVVTASPVSQPGGSMLATTAVQTAQSGLSYRYAATFGTPDEPYLDNPNYLNGPRGMYMDTSNNLYVVESGDRLLKYGPAGNLLLKIGKAGVCQDICGAHDLALDGAGNIWLVSSYGVRQFAPDGHLLQAIGNWQSGEPVGFSDVSGIAFDSQGRMFLSDTNHSRVLVYTFTGDTPVYSATLGVANQPGGDDGHFNGPASLAVDSSNRLYVADIGNSRVQRCSLSGGSWSCTTFATADNPGGYGNISVWVDGSNMVYITNSHTDKVSRCSSAGNCSELIDAGELGPGDVVADTAGNIFVSYPEDDTIRKYNSSGGATGIFAGVSGVPYLTDNQHINGPTGIVVDANGNLAVVAGNQLLKMDANGNRIWAYGVPGVGGSAGIGTLFGPTEVNADANGKFYVAAQLNIQIINADGTYANTLGTGCCGGDYGFFFTNGVAVDRTTGTIYASDTGTDRVKVYNSALVYQTSLGESNVPGSDNAHFNDPESIAVDQNGNIYVIDAGNSRIQKFNSALVYQKTFPLNPWGLYGNLTVDSQGSLFIAEGNRVYVYTADGNYLATIGAKDLGKDQPATSFVAVDSAGNVYIASNGNHCVVKYVPGVPDWQQVNMSGFSPTVYNGSTSPLEVFAGSLYAGATNGSNGLAGIWRLDSGQPAWRLFSPAWTANNGSVPDLQAFGTYLYAATSNTSGAELWRTNGTTWAQVVSGGFGDSKNTGINVLAVFNGSLYAATSRDDGVAQIWRSASGNAGSWSKVVGNGFGSGGIASDLTMDVYNGALYLGLGRSNVAELWKTTNGTNWTPVFTNGLGAANTHVSAMAEFNGNFYIGMRNTTTGGSVWRSSNGIDFSPVFTDGLGNLANNRPYGLTVYAGQLYLAFSNTATGAEVWRSADGMEWVRVAANGWDDPSNLYASYFDKGMAVFENFLHVSTIGSGGSGSQVWRYNLYNLAPVMMRVLPVQGRADQPNDLHLYGQNFSAQTTVTLGTTPPELLPVQFVSDTELIASVPVGMTPGVYSLALQNPNTDISSYPGAYTVIAPAVIDLSASASGFWTDPPTLMVGQPMKVGLIVHREGGSSPLTNVKVRFYNGNPAGGGTLIGDGTIPTMGPRGDFSTSAVSWPGVTSGFYTLFAVINPDSAVDETDKTNNTVSRQVVVLPLSADRVPPTVDSFTINNGGQQTNSTSVVLDAAVSDPAPSSGVANVMYIEYEYSQGAGQWIPVQSSPWLPYTASHNHYPWTLGPIAGLHYLQVWGSDRAGNISRVPGVASINYRSPSQTLMLGQVLSYRYNLIAGQQFTVTVTPTSGDPDLYVWTSNGVLLKKSNLTGTVVDTVSFTVPSTGVYQVEVRAFSATTFSIVVNLNGAVLPGSQQDLQTALDKPIPASPILPVSSQPEQQAGLPAAPIVPYWYIYLPLLHK